MEKPFTLSDLPQYFDVDGVLVKVEHDKSTREVFGITAHGTPYPPLKAASEGKKVTEKEFNKAKS